MKDLVFLGWWKDDEFQTVTAVLKDVSLGGALVVSNTPVPQEELVWISLYQVPPTEWVEAKVVEVKKVPGPKVFSRRSSSIRIKFFQTCSYDLFRAAIDRASQASGR